MVPEINLYSSVHQAIADELLSLAGAGLRKQENKGYFVLERKLGKSSVNKNAISFIREGVSFMIRDWSSEATAFSLGLPTVRSKSFPRLVFPTLTLEQVRANAPFFEQLTNDAKVEAEHLQSVKSTRRISTGTR